MFEVLERSYSYASLIPNVVPTMFSTLDVALYKFLRQILISCAQNYMNILEAWKCSFFSRLLIF